MVFHSIAVKVWHSCDNVITYANAETIFKVRHVTNRELMCEGINIKYILILNLLLWIPNISLHKQDIDHENIDHIYKQPCIILLIP